MCARVHVCASLSLARPPPACSPSLPLFLSLSLPLILSLSRALSLSLARFLPLARVVLPQGVVLTYLLSFVIDSQ